MILQISAKLVKELRNKTGAGMMDCKKALQASEGNIDKAIDSLRKQGISIANKKANRVTTQGIIDSYIHSDSRIGTLVELNCETDFVARRTEFRNLAKDIAMQLAASPLVRYINKQSIPEDFRTYEYTIEFQKGDLLNKSETIKSNIIKGRVEKKLSELSLLDQPFVKDPNVTIQDLIEKYIALLGENIKIKRFARFVLGEGDSNV